ncbi:hypothetical protein MUCCIDRAFT_112323 [Mucor lusitanicus CBS 277.49]|uniref:Uncharacterized protein n=1 Tax=Mucor lusitanicus CBS 277.49 TaxID=747725 RepID=A0A168J928_MUCCL|nr:hypothetical protein MUCCIDRAFT_112323 [Mucor lusitanicus CBS 277.49]
MTLETSNARISASNASKYVNKFDDVNYSTLQDLFFMEMMSDEEDAPEANVSNDAHINAEGSFTFTVNLNPSALQTTADALSTEDVTFIIASVPPVASASVPATTFEFHLRCIEDDPTSDDDRNSSDNDNILVGDNIFGSNYSTTKLSIRSLAIVNDVQAKNPNKKVIFDEFMTQRNHKLARKQF